ncbi:MAG: hypothetical protein NC217_00040 [Muribaculaceae bacterium]|nr:hypothetical protein [Muribaculaceae bacterium]
MATSSNYESIKTKLKKLLALAERGEGGEARNARILLDRQCEHYGISVDALLDTEKKKFYKFNIGARKIDITLFTQCYCSLKDEKQLPYRLLSKSVIVVELTAYEFAELRSMFEWHKANFKKDLEQTIDALMLSYCDKHDLSSKGSQHEDLAKPLTKEDILRIKRAMAMRDNLNDNHYRKMIER